MNFVEPVSAIALLAAFLTGMLCGVIGSVCHGSRCEDRKRTMLRGAPGPVSRGARVILGLHAWEDDRYFDEFVPRRTKAPASVLPDEPASCGRELDR